MTESVPVVDTLLECVYEPVTVGLCDIECDTHFDIVELPETENDDVPVELVERLSEPVPEVVREREMSGEAETLGDAVVLRLVSDVGDVTRHVELGA